jgi:triacylglycerol lipase
MSARLIIALLLASFAGVGCSADDTQDEPATNEAEDLTKDQAAEATHEGKADFSFDLCERRGWYGDGECDWFCIKRDPDCNLPALGPEPAGFSARHPIVLAHGFDASPTNRWGFNGVAKALEADGHIVHVASVPPYNSPEVRAMFLADHVDAVLERTGADKVNIIAHSMGGLDTRVLVSGMGYGDRVASVTTISSPHGGTHVADVALGLVPGAADTAINALAKAWGRTFSEVAEDTDVRAALTGLAESSAPQFDADYPADERVFYQSWAGVSSVFGIRNPKDAAACEGLMLEHEGASADRMDATLVPMAALTAHGTRLLPNDGLATVQSAKYGKFQGCIPADHLDEVGQVGDEGPDRHTGFDHLRFYRNISFDLAQQGF